MSDKKPDESFQYKELLPVLQKLGSAQSKHRQWIQGIMRYLVCNGSVPLSEPEVAHDAHHHCDFGKWYYGEHPRSLQCDPLFIAIEPLHREMHEAATLLLRQKQSHQPIESTAFDQFANKVDWFSEATDNLRDELSQQVYSLDPLTGALNRAAMDAHLSSLMQLVRREMMKACIVMFDIDHFKQLNDKYGHSVGDQALCNLVQQLKRHLRPFDKLFRYGGEEFLLALGNTDLATAAVIAERMRAEVSELSMVVNDQEIPLNVSAGVAALNAGESVEHSVKRADKALYKAKQSGRNRIVVAKEA